MNQIRYTAWYDPEFPIDVADATHSAVDIKLLEFLVELTEDIRQNGLRNPVQVVCKHTQWTVHPGKCRVAACKQLGWTTIPAIVVNYDLPGFQADKIPPHCTALGSQSQVNRYLDADSKAQMSHRWLQIKKIHRNNLEKPYIA